MAQQHDPPSNGSLAELREQAQRLATDLAGPLRRVSVQSGDTTIEVEWQPPGPGRPGPAGQSAAAPPTSPPITAPAGPAPDEPDEPAGGQFVVSSPMVGTFYRAPSPGAPPFVEVGEPVSQGQTIAIVEAMKLFNPIVADSPGVLAEVLAQDGQPIEFGQPLLRFAAGPPAAPGAGKE